MKATKDKEKLDRIVLATSVLQLAQSMGDEEKIAGAKAKLRDACDDFSKDYVPMIDQVLTDQASAVEVAC